MALTNPEFLNIRVGEQIVSQVVLSLEEVATFARLSGDLNPLHHDVD